MSDDVKAAIAEESEQRLASLLDDIEHDSKMSGVPRYRHRYSDLERRLGHMLKQARAEVERLRNIIIDREVIAFINKVGGYVTGAEIGEAERHARAALDGDNDDRVSVYDYHAVGCEFNRDGNKRWVCVEGCPSRAALDGDDHETLHGEFIRRDGTTSDTYRHDR